MKHSTYKGIISSLKPHQIFVYGSNPEGRHGGGAAKYAYEIFGAEWGVGHGLRGQSYGIVTTDLRSINRPNVPQIHIIEQIKELYKFAERSPDAEFFIIYSGKEGNVNLSGYSNEELALMFWNRGNIPSNIVFEEEFYKIIKTFNNVSNS